MGLEKENQLLMFVDWFLWGIGISLSRPDPAWLQNCVQDEKLEDKEIWDR